VHDGMQNTRTGIALCSSLSRCRTHNGPPRFQIPDYDNEKMGPKCRAAVSDSSGKAAVLFYRLYYYLFFDVPSFHVIEPVDGNTEHNIYGILEPICIAENTFRGLQWVQKYVGQAVRCRKSENDPWTSFFNADCAVLELRRKYPLLNVSQTRTAATDGAELCGLHWERLFGDLPGERWSQYEDQDLWLSNKGRYKLRQGGVALEPICYNIVPKRPNSGPKLGYGLPRTGGRAPVLSWEETICHHFHGEPRAGEILGFSSGLKLQLTPDTIHWNTKMCTRSPRMGPTNGHWVWTRKGHGPMVIRRSIAEAERVLHVPRQALEAVSFTGVERHYLTGGLVDWRLLNADVFVEAHQDMFDAVRDLWYEGKLQCRALASSSPSNSIGHLAFSSLSLACVRCALLSLRKKNVSGGCDSVPSSCTKPSAGLGRVSGCRRQRHTSVKLKCG